MDITYVTKHIPKVYNTGLAPFDYVLGNDFKEGGIIKIDGHTHSGKSSILASILGGITANIKESEYKALYISAEESLSMVVTRLGAHAKGSHVDITFVTNTFTLGNVLERAIENSTPLDILFIDSINMIAEDSKPIAELMDMVVHQGILVVHTGSYKDEYNDSSFRVNSIEDGVELTNNRTEKSVKMKFRGGALVPMETINEPIIDKE